MRTKLRFTGMLFALCAFLAGALPGHSAVLVGTQGSSFFSAAERGVFDTFQPVADVFVGSSDVSIGGFGVYGAAEAPGRISWVIFQNDSLLWQSASYDVAPGAARWYDVSYSTTLSSGQTYTMGVVANDLFAWGRNAESDEGYGDIGGSGLVIRARHTIAQLDVVQGGNFGSDPILARGFELSGDQMSVRVFDSAGAAPPPIPEPAEWSMLLAGLLIVAFVANRRRGDRRLTF